MEIKLREFRKGDEKEISRMIVETWGYDEGLSDMRKAMHFGFMSLHGYMMYHSFARVAEADGKPVGIIVCTLRKARIHPGIALRMLYHKAAVYMHSDTYRGMRALSEYSECYRQMESKPGISWKGFDAELDLFIVSADVRGHGVGGMLWNSMLEFYEKEGVRSYRLRTDTDCNYKFYGKRGMTRIAESFMHWSAGSGHDLELYVYGMSADGRGCDGKQ